jgi:hypothetical protein
MQVVRVEFVTHFNNVQEAVDVVSSHLPCLRRFPGTRIESWDVYSVDETVVTKVNRPVEDGKVVY